MNGWGVWVDTLIYVNELHNYITFPCDKTNVSVINIEPSHLNVVNLYLCTQNFDLLKHLYISSFNTHWIVPFLFIYADVV